MANNIGKKLRLILFEDCNRNCEGCCNKDWNISGLPSPISFKDWGLVMLTGGEPMLRPQIIKHTVRMIRKETDAPIYLYTAKVDNIPLVLEILNMIDGITITLHDNGDVQPFLLLNQAMAREYCNNIVKSFRLNVFKNITLHHVDLANWIVKDNIEWIKNCQLPDGEVLMKLV